MSLSENAPRRDRNRTFRPSRYRPTAACMAAPVAGRAERMREAWSYGSSALPLVTTAIHAGHDLRPEVAERIALDHEARRREEDPFTDRITRAEGSISSCTGRASRSTSTDPATRCVHHPRGGVGPRRVADPAHRGAGRAVAAGCTTPSTRCSAGFLDDLAARGRFVVLDVHSYNHRRGGPARARRPGVGQPGGERRHRVARPRPLGPRRRSLHRRPRSAGGGGHRLDVRENVRFEGGYLSQWVHERYPDGVRAGPRVQEGLHGRVDRRAGRRAPRGADRRPRRRSAPRRTSWRAGR